jgi:hypothetical protein
LMPCQSSFHTSFSSLQVFVFDSSDARFVLLIALI